MRSNSQDLKISPQLKLLFTNLNSFIEIFHNTLRVTWKILEL